MKRQLLVWKIIARRKGQDRKVLLRVSREAEGKGIQFVKEILNSVIQCQK